MVNIFAVSLLMLHAAIVLVGSLWQLLWERSVINALSIVPEYLPLGLGSWDLVQYLCGDHGSQVIADNGQGCNDLGGASGTAG